MIYRVSLEDNGVLDAYMRVAFLANSDCYFGGCNILLFGDIGQLPPVRGERCIQSKGTTHRKGRSAEGYRAFCSFKDVFDLRQVFRFDTSDEDAHKFHSLLKRLRLLSPISEDYALLRSLCPQLGREFHVLKSVQLFSTNHEVDEANNVCLQALSVESNVRVFNFNDQPALALCEGARVMLTFNLNVRIGHGATYRIH